MVLALQQVSRVSHSLPLSAPQLQFRDIPEMQREGDLPCIVRVTRETLFAHAKMLSMLITRQFLPCSGDLYRREQLSPSRNTEEIHRPVLENRFIAHSLRSSAFHPV